MTRPWWPFVLIKWCIRSIGEQIRYKRHHRVIVSTNPKKQGTKLRMNFAMVTSASRHVCIFYIYILLFYSIQPPVTVWTYSMLTSGTDTEISTGNTSPIIRQEFFECSRKQSCIHVMKVGRRFQTVYGIGELSQKEHKAGCIYEKLRMLGKAKSAISCLDFYRDVIRRNGKYEMIDQASTSFKVFCDFKTVWLTSTLVASFPYRTNPFSYLFFKDKPRNESNQIWVNYR